MRDYLANRFYLRGLTWLGLLNTLTACLFNRVLVLHCDPKSRRVIGWHIGKGTQFPRGVKSMGRRGPAPKPTVLNDLAGNPSKRKKNTREPKPASNNLVAPDHLSPAAKAEWDRLVALFTDLKLLTNVDADALAMYADTYARWAEATSILSKQGMIVYTENGFPIQSPYLSIVNQTMKVMQKFLAEFGMTPASRTRLQVPEEPEDDPFESFVNKKKRS